MDVIRLRRASAYGAGQGLDQSLAVCRRLADLGILSIVGYTAMPGDSPRQVADVHREAFRRLADEGLACHVSVKLGSLDDDAGLFDELVAAATRSGHRLHIDALRPETAEATARLWERLPRSSPVGITLPGRWRRSVEDASRAMASQLSVRVVKGHWPDRRGPDDQAAGFLRVIDSLCGYGHGVGVATHDERLLRESLHRLRRSQTPCEVELFLGLPFKGPAAIAKDFGAPVRLYVPFGDAWPGYGLADLVTHPRTVRWLIQDLIWGRDKTWRSIGNSPLGR